MGYLFIIFFGCLLLIAFTPATSKQCVDGVSYISYINGGIVKQVDVNGNIVLCKDKK